MAASYSWNLTSQPFSGVPPDPGAYVQQPLGKDVRKKQFERGMKFANVPGARADFVIHGGPRVYHINSVQNHYIGPISNEINFKDRTNGLSGAIRYRRFKLPDSVKGETRNLDSFGNPIFPGTGR